VTAVVLAKLVGSVGALSLVGAGAAGVPVGLAWCLLELGSSPLSAPFGQSPPTPFGTQHDTPPPAGQIGTIVHPVDFTPPDQAGTVVSWPPADTIKVNGRQYTTLVHRDDPDPAKRQVWFPPRVTGNGYRGRWGPRVAPDPLEIPRRAGMRLPEFAGMFFTALAKRLSA